MADNLLKENVTSSGEIYKKKGSEKEVKKGEVFIDRGMPLPPGYGENVLVILVKDPHWIYSYWEFNEQLQNNIKKIYGEKIFEESKMVIRVKDKNSNSFFDVEISPFARSWYIRVNNADIVYYCELGLIDKNGNYIKLLESNTIEIPPDKPSQKTDSDYMIIKEDFEKIFKLSGGYEIGQNSFDIMRILSERLEKGVPSSGNLFGAPSSNAPSSKFLGSSNISYNK
ncbi:MAG TPA: DUF4912 domain-containing protein [bacterium]|nr:DUF4912 domain-containing protein [bacterium]HOL47322.1 DUF4912 domain-containing protein [bacterium]HPQ17974.1 DUF4912 domain-containing protein [bacterium]